MAAAKANRSGQLEAYCFTNMLQEKICTRELEDPVSGDSIPRMSKQGLSLGSLGLGFRIS